MDVLIIEGLRRSDDAAFSELFHQYHSKLYYYFLSKLQLEEVASELVQTTLIKCWQYRQHFTIDLTLSHQMFRIAKTCLIDLIRQKAKERLVYLEDFTELTHIPEAASSIHPGLDQVTATLDSLPPERRKIIKFRLEGLTNKEIAKQLGISKKTVENQLNKAVKEIRSKVITASELSYMLLFVILI